MGTCGQAADVRVHLDETVTATCQRDEHVDRGDRYHWFRNDRLRVIWWVDGDTVRIKEAQLNPGPRETQLFGT